MGELVIIDAELEPIEPPAPVDLDALEQASPAESESEVIDAELVEWRSPLDPDEAGEYPTLLRGGVVTDPAAREVINASVDYALMPWWRRLVTRRPRGYSADLHLSDWWVL